MLSKLSDRTKSRVLWMRLRMRYFLRPLKFAARTIAMASCERLPFAASGPEAYLFRAPPALMLVGP